MHDDVVVGIILLALLLIGLIALIVWLIRGAIDRGREDAKETPYRNDDDRHGEGEGGP
jgi:F0F1-type ATP synthase assembly protein I